MKVLPPKFLIAWLQAHGKPIEPILGSDGSLYMERYTIWQFKWLWLRLHITHRSDEDPHMHDHPWRNWSWILDNGYIEHMPDSVECRRRGDIVYRGLKSRHRLELYADDNGGLLPCTSLFITGKWQQVWGFYKNGVKIPWRLYLANHNERVLRMKKERAKVKM